MALLPMLPPVLWKSPEHEFFLNDHSYEHEECERSRHVLGCADLDNTLHRDPHATENHSRDHHGREGLGLALPEEIPHGRGLRSDTQTAPLDHGTHEVEGGPVGIGNQSVELPTIPESILATATLPHAVTLTPFVAAAASLSFCEEIGTLLMEIISTSTPGARLTWS